MQYVSKWEEHHLGLKACFFEQMDMNVTFIKKIKNKGSI